MSIDDLPYTADEAYQGGFERTPPQDIPAEQSVLGGMLLSKDAIAEVIEVIKAVDFYKPAHEAVFGAILELYGRGEPADPVTVAALLTKRGDINRIGGAPYLHTLINSVPTAANAGYYAEIVKERAVLRRLVEAGTRIVQMGYSTDGSDVEQIVDAAQQEMYQRHRRPHQRGLHPPGRRHGGRARRDRVDLQPLRPDDRRPHRLPRPRRPDQRPAPRADGDHRGAPGHRQGAGAGHPAAHSGRLDHDGRGAGRRPAARRRRPAHPRGRGHRGA